MKKLINDPGNVVREMLEGSVALSPGQAIMEGETVVLRDPLPDAEARKVAVLSGGGSGHEPAHAGYVGHGMLTAAVAGDVFTSPSTDAVLAALRVCAGPAGAVLIVKNYTGDRLNFGLAAELAAAEGIATQVVVVADDVALRNTVEKGRRRGIAGTVLIHKIAGAAAEAGRPLGEVAELARAAAAELGSMGVALGACTVPAAGRPGFALADDEIELGLGIHGEAGVRRGPMQPADALVDTILSTIVDDLGLGAGARVALLVNGLGATPPMELDIVARGALAWLSAHGLVTERAFAGTFLSALDMPGVSLSLLRVDDERLALIDAESRAPAWPGRGHLGAAPRIRAPERAEPHAGGERPLSQGMELFRTASEAAAKALIAAEADLTDLDARAGDGDLGASLSRGARAILDLPDGAWQTPAGALAAIANALRRAIAGSSGPFYATGLMRASRTLGEAPAGPASQLAQAFAAGVKAVAELGGAGRGDRTMLDALMPAADALGEAAAKGLDVKAALAAAADAARQGADATAAMTPRLGRASYLGARAVGVPDGGAVAVSIWLRALAEA